MDDADRQRPRRGRQAARPAGLLLAAALTIASCGGSSGSNDAAKAQRLLQKALGEHAAGRIADAKRDYLAVLDADPQNKFAYYNLGLIATAARDANTAEQEYRRALVVDPDYEPALYNLAILRTREGARDEAIDLYRHAVRVAPKDANAHYNLGLLLRAAGERSQGDVEVLAAIRLNPKLGTPPVSSTTSPTSAP
jgi:tetratricopeptide (TPR) repeat protein